MRKRFSTPQRRLTGLLAGAAISAMMAGAAGAQTVPADQQNPAGSQTTEPSQLEEIVVTARKRAENLQDTPVSITAFTSETLENRAATDLSIVGQSAPNVTVTTGVSGSSSSAFVYIRGIGQIDAGPNTEPGVGIYLDGVYLARAAGGILDLVGVDRVEVLRGPQGVLFGRNSVGGAVNVITRKPDGSEEGRAEVTVGNFGRTDFRGFYTFPIADNLAASLAVTAKHHDGFGRRPGAQDVTNDQNPFVFRGALSWDPSDRLNLLFAVDATKQDQSRNEQTLVDTFTINPVTGAPNLLSLYNAFVLAPSGRAPVTDAFVTGDPDVSNDLSDNDDNNRVFGASLTASYDLGDISLKSITAYRSNDYEYGFGDGLPYRIFEQVIEDQQEQFTQELQLNGKGFGGRLDYVLGAFYFDETVKDFQEQHFLVGLYRTRVPIGPGGAFVPFPVDFEFFGRNRVEASSIAGYVHGSLQLTDQLSVSGGIRYTSEEKDVFIAFTGLNSGLPQLPPQTVESDGDNWSPRVSVEYEPTDNLLFYGSYSQGFRAGGVGIRTLNQSTIRSYAPETVDAYELGFKSQFWDRRVQLNLAAFYSDYQDIQISVISTTAVGSYIENAAAATIKGFELEAVALPFDNTRLEFSAGYTDAQYDELQPGAVLQLNNRLLQTPEWTVNAAVERTVDLPNGGTLLFRGDLNYRSDYFTDSANASFQEGFTIADARVAYDSPDGIWQVAAYVKNIGDKRYLTYGSSIPDFGLKFGLFSPPRQFGITLARQF